MVRPRSGLKKPLSRPAAGRPQGSGLDNGVPRCPPATMEDGAPSGAPGCASAWVTDGAQAFPAGGGRHPSEEPSPSDAGCSLTESRSDPMCSAAFRSSLEMASV